MSEVTADRLDELFAVTAHACRRWLVAYEAAKPAPSLTGAQAHDKLMDAHNELEEVIAEIASIFE